MHILYTPFPPQASVVLTTAQLARLDRRYAHPDRLPGDLALLVQDSAALLGAALTVRTAQGAWDARPDHAAQVPGLDEAAWADLLGLTPAPPVACAGAAFLSGWTDGVVYVFRGARLAQRVNTALFCDRMELEFLLAAPGRDGTVLRAHRLRPDGTLSAWRVTL